MAFSFFGFPKLGPARDLDFDMGTEGQAIMTICQFPVSILPYRCRSHHHDDGRSCACHMLNHRQRHLSLEQRRR
ncbi:hypothetical protein [Mesorhizobium sp.]|uniref:hypothetical protein n=1 Tax=Mesorhizobium sp. TaxID=1871066 RepID=UPI000FE6EE28|nr:hypothetical protein [Mesorhizobium sp.]RWP80301.1 MAG: hypothetical protein EOR09_00435 [Mesorhizobium sp.]